MILWDFQIYASTPDPIRAKAINVASFPIYEAVRFDLRLRRPRAPFAKICISLVERGAHGKIRMVSALGICEVFAPVDFHSLYGALPAVSEFVGVVRTGLAAFAEVEGFSDPGIAEVLDRCLQREFPCTHRFDGLTRRLHADLLCETWFLAQDQNSLVEARLIERGREVDRIPLKCAAGPLWFESDFPIRRSRVRGTCYELLDRDGNLLASIDTAVGRRASPRDQNDASVN